MGSKKEQVLAFDVVSRLCTEEVIQRHGDELEGGYMAWRRPDLFGFACGVAVDVGTGEVLRFGPFDRRRMLSRLEGADLLVSWTGGAHEFGVLGMPQESGARARHLSIGVGFEYSPFCEEDECEVASRQREEDENRPRSWYSGREKGRLAGLLSGSERRARWTAETHRAVRHLERAASPPRQMLGGEGSYLDPTWIHISLARAIGSPS